MRDFFASCPKGLEYLLVDELKALAALDVHEGLAGVYFRGELEAGYRACLWSRLASRVLLPIAEFGAEDGDALYAGALAIDWAQHLDVQTSFAVAAVGKTHGVNHSQYAALRVKDAIVDQFRSNGGERPNVDTENPALRVHVALRRGKAIVSIDLSGAPLHQRGYRQGKGVAPLKENLAAAMLLRAGWPAVHAEGGGIVDPMCGSGTLLIEAALMVADVAPGLRRERTRVCLTRPSATHNLRSCPASFISGDNRWNTCIARTNWIARVWSSAIRPTASAWGRMTTWPRSIVCSAKN